MEERPAQPSRNRKKAAVKAALLVLFILLAIYIVRFTSLRTFLTREMLEPLLESSGIWGPVIFIGV